ncbi:alpha/beta hydrolase fold protein [[Leptolyngbya] sp. PCC 7376]|uniref:alpha/beta fold hydrolase n=1 Tax=[Leptolyngbya] sp. PCC 7376 TaxID=111781 RepID=UPI00029EC844|nr:alpha/beta fold hydrolase [[Leptolyngbya] sp. PCC 7376]AFY36689.1 alpha/beta hydrolase fold protein [[Leptolyngbya] sp. PCC 7376]
MTVTATAPMTDNTWQWQGFDINYRCYGTEGPPVVMIHGFGASVGHWRKNLPVLGQQYRCYAIDLLGFGKSAKPTPHIEADYTFDTWAAQIQAFCEEVIGEPAFLVANSIGCVVAMQTAVSYPEWVKGIVSLNFSLRLFHEKNLAKSPIYQKWGVPIFQKVLTGTPLGKLFFKQIAQPKAIRNVLSQAYNDTSAITDELIDILLTPAKDKGAVDVFLAFISYSQGALPDELLPLLPCPAVVMWGTEDPWEPIALGQKMVAQYSDIEFIPLEGVGHCPQDEAPELVNAQVMQWLAAQEA